MYKRQFPVKALKGFGGGDGYAAAFLYGLLEGKELLDCLEMGSAEAAMLVASHACSADIPGDVYKRQVGRKMYPAAILLTGIVSVIYSLEQTRIVIPVITGAVSLLPGYGLGLGWLIPAAIGIGIGRMLPEHSR